MNLEEFHTYDDEELCKYVKQRTTPWQGITLRQTRQTTIFGETDCEPFTYLGGNLIKTDRWIGTFSIRGIHYKIIPRVGHSRFWAMLTAAEGLPSAGTIKAGSGVSSGELGKDILALLWTSALEHGWRSHGVTKGYVYKEEPDAVALRGQLDLYRQLAENELGNKHRIACAYDDLTYDNPVNRGIMTCIKQLKRDGIFPFSGITDNGSRREMLIDWQDRLASLGVRADDTITPSTRIRWTRANTGFRHSHDLAVRLLRHRGAETSSRGLDEALLFDTAAVWEVFLWGRLQRVVGRMDRLKICSPNLQNGSLDWLMKYNGVIRGGMLPDFQLKRKSLADGTWELVAILDAKYRSLESIYRGWVPSREEVVQMALYSCRSGQKSKPVPCALLYPRVANASDSIGINSDIRDESGPVGSAPLEVPSQPLLSWWVIDLLEPSNGVEWINKVDNQLEKVLKMLI